MKINNEIFSKVENAGSQVLVVTKYFNTQETQDIYDQVRLQKSFLALGENRIDELGEKDLPREKVNFIGKIQSNKIEKIFTYCTAVHSLESVKHAEIFNSLAEKSCEKFKVFLQINISEEPQKSGVLPKNFPNFLSEILKFKNLEILGISAIGAGEFTLEAKQEEFCLLKKIRDEFLTHKKISAGTSRDFEVALEQGIEIVRIGRVLFDL